MQNNHLNIEPRVEQSLFLVPVKKPVKARKWREIEAIKARQKLAKELQDIDQSYELSVADFSNINL